MGRGVVLVGDAVCAYLCGAVLGVPWGGVQVCPGHWGVGWGYVCQDDV